LHEEGRSPRDRLESFLERAERKGDWLRAQALAEELKQPPLPPALEYIWSSFLRIRARKAAGEHGPEPISWLDFDAFNRLTRLRLTPWELRLLEELDSIYLDIVEKKRPRKPAPGEQGQGQGQKPEQRVIRPRR
jgi:hypothetical protein